MSSFNLGNESNDSIHPYARVLAKSTFGSKSSIAALPSLPHSLPHEIDDEYEGDHSPDNTSYVEFDLSKTKKRGDSANNLTLRVISNSTRNQVFLNTGDSSDNVTKTNDQPNNILRTTTDTPFVEFNFDNTSHGSNTVEKDALANIAETNCNRIHAQDPNQNRSHKVDHDNHLVSSFHPVDNDTNKRNDLQKLQNPLSNDDDFFNDNNWKNMKTFTEVDYYNEKGELEFKNHPIDSFENRINTQGYTKIDTEEQVAKYANLDKKTDFLFKISNDNHRNRKKANYDPEDLNYDEDSDYDPDDDLDSYDTLKSTKEMLTESQRFAYVGLTKLITVEMATNLAKLKMNTSNKIAKQLSLGQRNFSNWTMYIMSKLYDHLELDAQENDMIENLSKHGVEIKDLSSSLLDKSISHHKLDYDVSWVIICDLFLLLLSDGYYDARSRTLLVKFADIIGISNLEILQFERRLIDSLEIETKDKTIENDDSKLADRNAIEKHIKKNRKKRLAYIGLATVGGSLAIGLSAGLLAPVIGAGIAAGLTTVGITGTTGFLAGVGGTAIITTTGVAVGAKVGNKAGTRRAGDVHTFEMKPLHNNKRTNLIITVSGWMNGDLDDVRLPFSTVDPVMGDMFSLLWEPEMLRSMGQTITILASEALSTSIQQILGATILTALMSAIQLPMALSKLSYLIDNPWNVSLDRAWKAGIILAETIISGNVGVRPITLVGFSLGSRLIYSCLLELAKRGGYGLVENVILLGNPIAIKTDQIAMARSIVSGRFINGYSNNDWILGYLFRATSGGLSRIAGLAPIEGYDIENVDCTNLIEGHMGYRTAIPKIMKQFGWEVLSEEFVEIEEPDLEQKERQRKLLSEFDEARAKMKEEAEESDQKKKTWKDWFKPKNKDWWDIREKPAENGNENDSTATKTSEENTQEYMVEPIFDVSAIENEIKEIEKVADKNPQELDEIRKDKDEPLNLPINEDMPDITLGTK